MSYGPHDDPWPTKRVLVKRPPEDTKTMERLHRCYRAAAICHEARARLASVMILASYNVEIGQELADIRERIHEGQRILDRG